MKPLLGALVLAAITAWASTERLAVQSLEEADLIVMEIADSGNYLLYSYAIANPAGSTWALATIRVDVSATSGTPPALAATGEFLDLTIMAQAAVPLTAFAELGPISPGAWWATLNRTAEFSWSAPSDGAVHTDSIAPGDTLVGFGLRTTYLPGLSELVAQPTWQECCSVADTVSLTFPRRASFAVTSMSVAPRYMPSEVTIELLQEQAEAVCTDPLWITDEELCEEIADSLALTAARFAVANYAGARQAVLHAGQLLPPHHDPGPIHDNAYWMLGANAAQLYLYNFPHDPLSELSLCAGGPASTDVIFDLDPAGGDLLVGTPLHVDAEQVGVDPLGSSCQAVWRFPLDGTSLEHVTVRVDSVTAGRSVDQIGVVFGADTTLIDGPQDSVVVQLDGSAPGLVYFLFGTP